MIPHPGHWLRRRIVSSSSASADLYFANACRGLIASLDDASWLAPTVFAGKEVLVVFRHDAGAVIDRHERRRIIYVLDDAVFSGCRDAALPRWYRRRLRFLECEAARRLLPRASHLVVSGEAVRRSLPDELLRPDLSVEMLRPYWSEPCADLDHHEDGGVARIAVLSSQVHARNRAFALDVIREVARQTDACRFCLPSDGALPRDLVSVGTVEPLAAGPWAEYRPRLVRQRFHLALYPTGKGAFDRARTVNKIIEHAIVGAAGIYSPGWAARAGIIDGESGVVCADDPPIWAEAIVRLLAVPGEMRRLAAGGQVLARSLNDPEPQRRFWASVLRIPRSDDGAVGLSE